MTARRHPGPTWIDAHLAPKGFVVRLYGDDDSLLIEQRITNPELAEPAAEVAADRANAYDGATCLVVYDGDSGRRLSPLEMALAQIVGIGRRQR